MEKKRCIRVDCETLFQPKRRSARYCSEKCASAERSKRYRARRADPLPLVVTTIRCVICDTPILAVADSGGIDRKYCGDSCKKTAEKLASKDE